MKRRDFLIGAASAAATTGFALTRGDRDLLAHPRLLAVLGADVVRGIGLRYRGLVPREGDREPLRSAILAGGPPHVSMSRGALAQQVRDDFATGRTVLLDGWVLSVTEARQCALFSLLSA